MSAVRSDACVLLTGRDDAVRAVAYQIHRLSDWNQGPFTILDCSWSEDLIERALFGAFSVPAVGLPDVQARAGTVLLHQVGRLDRAVQSRLADRLVLHRAQNRPRCRLLASTSEALLARVADGTFDDRLYYRLNVIHLVIPSGRPIRSIRRMLGADEGFLLTRGLAHDGSVHAPTARRGWPRPGLRTR